MIKLINVKVSSKLSLCLHLEKAEGGKNRKRNEFVGDTTKGLFCGVVLIHVHVHVC